MKKVINSCLIFFLVIYSLNVSAQGGPKYSEDGNSLSASSVLGATNFMDLKIITNNQTRFIISADGTIILPVLSSSSSGITVLDISGKVTKLNFTGTADDVLFGNGTFANLSAATGWTTLAGKTFTNNKIGIGVSDPLQAFEVNGNAIFNGVVSAQEFIVGDVTSQGKNLRVGPDICLDGYDAATGMRNELCVFTQPLYLNSKPGINFNTIINDANAGNVGIGTNNPSAKLHVNGNLKVDGESFNSGTSHFFRISGMPGDSIIRFGDSTINFNYTTNAIFGSSGAGSGGTAVNKGLGLGASNSTGKGQNTVAIGLTSRAEADNSYTIGTKVKTTGFGAMSFGSGFGSTFLENNKPNSLMIGFNSNISTLFISSASGMNTTGNVGIATIEPEDKLQIGKELGKLTFGDAQSPALNYGTSYIGFNASRFAGGSWKTDGDGFNNGGAIIYGNVAGHLYFSRIGGTGGADQTGFDDGTILSNTSLFLNGETGSVGIGTTNPAGDFHIFNNGIVKTFVTTSTNDVVQNWSCNSLLGYAFGIDETGMGHIYENHIAPSPVISYMHGNVGIGTTCLPFGWGFKLSVNGRIICEEVKVRISDASGCWPDYVFNPNYLLKPLSEVKKYYTVYGHLEDIPSAKEVEEEGVSLGELGSGLTKKLEEAYLHLVKMDERLTQLEKENTELKNKVQKLEAQK